MMSRAALHLQRLLARGSARPLLPLLIHHHPQPVAVALMAQMIVGAQ